MPKIDTFYTFMAEMLEDYDKYVEYEKIGSVSRGIRLNTLKIDTKSFKELNLFKNNAESLRESGFAPESYFTDIPLTKHPYYFAGLYYSQEPSASCTVQALRPYIGERVLDMCAAPGGKSTQVASLMDGKGVFVANEIIYSRAKVLRSNIERNGVRNAIVTNNSPDEIARAYGGYFDTVIVDAPCSGEGMFLKEPQARDMWSEEYVHECVARQLKILDSADTCLQEGGYLVYSTCTFNKYENEGVVDKFRKKYGYELINIDNIKACSRSELLPEAIKVFPHRHGGAGHFVALMRKASANEKSPKSFVDSFKHYRGNDGEKLFAELSSNQWGELREYKDGLFILPSELPIAKGINVISAGVKAFDIISGTRLQPHHALSMAIRRDETQRIVEMDEFNARRYLAGEALPTTNEIKGYALATIDGYPMGLVKVSDGLAKNHLPKGLRINNLNALRIQNYKKSCN